MIRINEDYLAKKLLQLNIKDDFNIKLLKYGYYQKQEE